jgi:hypothetical protein
MHKRIALIAALFGALVACSATSTTQTNMDASAKTVQVDQSKIAAAVTTACSDATTAAGFAAPFSAVPEVAGVVTFVNAGCGTADAVSALVSKAVNDPSTIAWAEKLAGQVNTAVSAAKKL